jgi:hypothetical protein
MPGTRHSRQPPRSQALFRWRAFGSPKPDCRESSGSRPWSCRIPDTAARRAWQTCMAVGQAAREFDVPADRALAKQRCLALRQGFRRSLRTKHGWGAYRSFNVVARPFSQASYTRSRSASRTTIRRTPVALPVDSSISTSVPCNCKSPLATSKCVGLKVIVVSITQSIWRPRMLS